MLPDKEALIFGAEPPNQLPQVAAPQAIKLFLSCRYQMLLLSSFSKLQQLVPVHIGLSILLVYMSR
jgi:hypothetical protein